MLLLGSHIIGTSVMGLQTGTKLAQIAHPVIDPSNLKIAAYVIEGPMLTVHPSLLRIADVREMGEIGMIVDSSDEFIAVDDVIKIEELYHLGFSITGMSVIDDKKHKLGKVEDYGLDSDSFIIEQLHVNRGIFKSLTETSLIINRSQIVEINNQHIVVRSTAKKVQPIMHAERRTYVNPFRNNSPQPDTTDVS